MQVDEEDERDQDFEQRQGPGSPRPALLLPGEQNGVQSGMKLVEGNARDAPAGAGEDAVLLTDTSYVTLRSLEVTNPGAVEARRRGGEVTGRAADVAVPAPAGVELVETPTAADLEREALARAGDADVVVVSSAVRSSAMGSWFEG